MVTINRPGPADSYKIALRRSPQRAAVGSSASGKARGTGAPFNTTDATGRGALPPAASGGRSSPLKASTGGGAQPPEARRMGGGGSMLAASTVLPLSRRARLSGSVGCGAQPPVPSSPDMLTIRFKAVLRMADSDREGQGRATTATLEPTRAPGTGSRTLLAMHLVINS